LIEIYLSYASISPPCLSFFPNHDKQIASFLCPDFTDLLFFAAVFVIQMSTFICHGLILRIALKGCLGKLDQDKNNKGAPKVAFVLSVG